MACGRVRAKMAAMTRTAFLRRASALSCLALSVFACDDSSSSGGAADAQVPAADAAVAPADAGPDAVAPDASLPGAALFSGPYALGDTLLDDEGDTRCFDTLAATDPAVHFGEVVRFPVSLTGGIVALELTVGGSCGARKERGRDAKTPIVTLRQGVAEIARFGHLAHADATDAVLQTTLSARLDDDAPFPPGEYTLEFAIEPSVEAAGPRDDVAFSEIGLRVSEGDGGVVAGAAPVPTEPRSTAWAGPYVVGDGAADDDQEPRCFQALGVALPASVAGQFLRLDFDLTGEASLLRFDVHRACGVARYEGRDPAAPTLRLLHDGATLQVLGRLAHADNNEELADTVLFLSAVDEDKMLPAGRYTLEFEAAPPPALKPDTGTYEDAAFADVEVRVVSGEATVAPAP